MRTYEVKWQTRVGMGYTFYNGTKIVQAESDTKAEEQVQKKLARELDRRVNDILIIEITRTNR